MSELRIKGVDSGCDTKAGLLIYLFYFYSLFFSNSILHASHCLVWHATLEGALEGGVAESCFKADA